MLRSALFIARADLAFMLRQKETLLWMFAMPLLFFYFIGTVTGGFGGGSADRPDPIALQAPASGGIVLDQVVRRLQQQNYRVDRPSTPDAFARYARRLTIAPPAHHPTVTDSVLAGDPVIVRLEHTGDPLAADLDRFRVTRAVYSVLADLAVIRSEGQEVTAAAFTGLAAAPRRLTLSVRPAGRRLEVPSGFSQAVPGTMVMFTMLILLTSGAIMLVVERRAGLLRRLASTPISAGAIVLGKWGSRMALGIVQLGFAMVVGRMLFRVDWGDSFAMVVLVLIVWAAFNASLALLLGNIARTIPQMTGLGILVSMVLAALGGCWWPIEITPPWMQAIAIALPTGWTMDALHKLVNFGYGASSAWPHVAALAVSAVAAGWGGAKVFRYQ